MKKNVDTQTIELYNAVKAAYFKYMPGIVRDNEYLKPLSVDMMMQLVNGRNVDNITIAEGTDLKKTIDLIPGYKCSLCSLPRIYKQVAKLAGATCEKITIKNTLPPYGITPEAATAKDNKKIYSLIKKVCKYDDLRIMSGVVYHDAARRCAVWTDAHKMICSPALYNPAAAGLCIDADGLTIGYKFPNYLVAVPDYKDCYELDTAAIVANCENALTISNALAKTRRSNEELYLFNAGMIDGAPMGLDCRFLPFLKVVSGAMYAIHASRPLIGKLPDGGFVLLMPRLVKQEKTPLNENTILYNEDTCINGSAPVATASTHAAFVPAIVTEDTTKDAAKEAQPEVATETATEAATEAPTETVTEAPTQEPEEAHTMPTVTDNDIIKQAARIKTLYNKIKYVSDAPTETETDRLSDNEQNNDTGHNTPLYTAEEVETMIADAVTAAIVKPVQQRIEKTRTRRSSLIVFVRRLVKAASLLLPLLISLVLLTAATDRTTADTAGNTNTAAAMTPGTANDDNTTLYVALPTITITAEAVTPSTVTPSIKKVASPSIKKVACSTVTPSNQKTDTDTDTTTGAATETETVADSAPTDNDADTLTICDGTAWSYTMMNWQ